MKLEKLISIFFSPLSPATRKRGRAASPGGQQDRVWPLGVCPGSEAGLRACQEPHPRGEALQSLHLQLREEVHEHRH